MKNLIFLTGFCLLASLPMGLQGQSIRKDYREFTTQEMNDYVAAISLAYNSGIIPDIAGHHGEHFWTNIHSSCTDAENFLPWHRFFLVDFEASLQQSNPAYAYLSIPYWDWRIDPVHTTFPAVVNFNLSPNFWGYSDKVTAPPSFLALSKFPGWNVTYDQSDCSGNLFQTTETLSRAYDNDAFGRLPLPSHITAALNLSTFFTPGGSATTTGFPNYVPNANNLVHRLEAWHNKIHVWVGANSTMDSQASPLDPSFFLHHGMIDKLWFDWEEQITGTQSVGLPGAALPMPHYDGTHDPNIVAANGTLNSRSIQRPLSLGSGRRLDLWYAEGGKVILDGANGSNFVASDVTAPYLYRYTAATTPGGAIVSGEMYVGDVQRDASNNIIADTKGGFVINTGVTCNFRSGGAIVFLPGFEAALGAVSEAKIISTPNGFAPGGSGVEAAERELTSSRRIQNESGVMAFKCFPNPVIDRATFEYSLSTSAEVGLKILDITGKIVASYSIGEQMEGIHLFDWETGALPEGLYFCRLQAGRQTQTIKLVVN